jgi:hypothetical protein
MSKRDDFPRRIKELLAKRVGSKCSNPDCRTPTSGPSEDPAKASNIGVAAHITAACKGGPRYDPLLSKEERSSANNGIWLCHKCARLIDSDERRYTAGLLRSWKHSAETTASLELRMQADSTDASNFQDALAQMPKLLANMAHYLRLEETKFIREFFVIPDRNKVLGGTEKPRLKYFEEDYDNLRLKLDILQDYGFIEDVTPKNCPIFRMMPHFAKLLLADDSNELDSTPQRG